MLEKLGLYLIIAALMFAGGYGLRMEQDSKATVVAANKQLKQNEVVMAGDSKTAAADKIDLDKMDQIAKDTIDAMPNPDAQCLDSNGVDQLRKLWGEEPPAVAH